MIFLAAILRRALTEQMRVEFRYLRTHAQARTALREVVEMPDPQADRVLRSIEQNGGRLSNVLAKEMPVLRKAGVWEELVEAVARVIQKEDATDAKVLDLFGSDSARYLSCGIVLSILFLYDSGR